MAAGGLCRDGLGTAGHGTLRRRRDHLVLGGNRIPARLYPPDADRLGASILITHSASRSERLGSGRPTGDIAEKEKFVGILI